jgi:ABC-type amino acid transport substrate-binding protein
MKFRLSFRRMTFWGSALLILVFFLEAPSVEAQKLDDTLEKIKAASTLNLGYLEFTPPFSSLGLDKKPSGYSIDLCLRVASALQKQLNVNLKLNWVLVTPETRIRMVEERKVDIECGTTTATLSRQEKVDFSLMTFVGGGSLLTLANSPLHSLPDLSGKRIAVISGTTTEKELARLLKEEFISAVIIPVKDHAEGRTAVEKGTVGAYASDQGILMGLAMASGDPTRFALFDDLFSYEPYALMLHRNDPAFRLAVNRALAALYRSDEILSIYDRWFGVLGKPSIANRIMYLINGLPE